jgi:histone deacetylase complex regulatory component SIN3
MIDANYSNDTPFDTQGYQGGQKCSALSTERYPQYPQRYHASKGRQRQFRKSDRSKKRGPDSGLATKHITLPRSKAFYSKQTPQISDACQDSTTHEETNASPQSSIEAQPSSINGSQKCQTQGNQNGKTILVYTEASTPGP